MKKCSHKVQAYFLIIQCIRLLCQISMRVSKGLLLKSVLISWTSKPFADQTIPRTTVEKHCYSRSSQRATFLRCLANLLVQSSVSLSPGRRTMAGTSGKSGFVVFGQRQWVQVTGGSWNLVKSCGFTLNFQP